MKKRKLKTPLGEEVEAKRKSVYLTQKTVGMLLGVSRDTVCNWENNKRRISQKHLRCFNKMINYYKIVLKKRFFK